MFDIMQALEFMNNLPIESFIQYSNMIQQEYDLLSSLKKIEKSFWLIHKSNLGTSYYQN